jgi:hypothetical protein
MMGFQLKEREDIVDRVVEEEEEDFEINLAFFNNLSK